MELCEAVVSKEDCLIGATRALFALKRASSRVDASVTWARVSASVLSRSKNRAISAEARRLEAGLYDLGRPSGSPAPEPATASDVVWVSFSRA